MPEHDAETVAFLKALGVEIRSWRTSRGLSRAALAEKVGISETTMGRIEREGPVDVGDTWKLASALGIGFAALVRRAEQRRELDVLAVADPGGADFEVQNEDGTVTPIEVKRRRGQAELSEDAPTVRKAAKKGKFEEPGEDSI